VHSSAELRSSSGSAGRIAFPSTDNRSTMWAITDLIGAHQKLSELPSEFHVYFDLAAAGYRLWWIPALGVLATAVLSVTAHLTKRWPKLLILYRDRDPHPLSLPLLAVACSVVAFAVTYTQYRRLRMALDQGSYRLVEGVVARIDSQEVGDSTRPERVMIVTPSDTVWYRFTPNLLTPAFNQAPSRGGPLREGAFVRIADVGGQIVRLEIRK